MAEFYILSLKYSASGEWLTWWKPADAGYTQNLDAAGRYSSEAIERNPDYYNDGRTTLAVPCEKAEALARGFRFVSNTASAERAFRDAAPGTKGAA